MSDSGDEPTADEVPTPDAPDNLSDGEDDPDYEPFDHPVNKRTMVILLVAVLVIATVVLVGVKVARADDTPHGAPVATAPPTTTAPATETVGSSDPTSSTTPPPDTTTTSPGAELPPSPYDVAEAIGSNGSTGFIPTSDVTTMSHPVPDRGLAERLPPAGLRR